MLLTTLRITKTGLRNFIRNAWLSSAATAVMTITLILVAMSYISNVALTSTIKSVVDKIDVSVFLKEDITPDEVSHFKKSLESSPNVLAVKYVTKEEAVAAYKEAHKTDKDLLNALAVSGNKLPPSFAIKSKDPTKLDAVAAVVDKPENKALLDPTAPPSYSGKRKTTIDRIVQFSAFFKLAGLVASIIFLIISTLIIFNTIRMAIFTRKEEIEIMKLVGATSWYIRGPFIFEAALYGIIAAIIASLVIYTLVIGGAPGLRAYIDTASVTHFLQHNVVLVILVELMIGIAIGALSSLVALTRYLKL